MSSINILQQVKTYNKERQLYGYQNQNCLVSKVCNHDFVDAHRNITKNLGDVLGIALPSAASSGSGLVVSTHAIYQNIGTLPVNSAAYSAADADSPERIFNLDKDGFWEKHGRSMACELGAKVEKNVAAHIAGAGAVDNPKALNNGEIQVNSGPTTFVDFISTGIPSTEALVQSQADWIMKGAPMHAHKVVLPTNFYPRIIGSDQKVFTPVRNDKTANSWDLGASGNPVTEYYNSNYLPEHTAGYLGENDLELTVSGTNDPSHLNVTEITMTGAETHVGALKNGDMGYFLRSSTLRATTFVGHMKTSQLVQFRVIADADSSAGTVVAKIVTGTYTEGQGLNSIEGHPLQNTSAPIVNGMKIKFLKSHKCGLRVAGGGFYLAMPRLKDLSPFYSSTDTDKDTKVSLRMYYGPFLGQDTELLVTDTIYGAYLDPRSSQRICIPLDGNYATP